MTLATAIIADVMRRLPIPTLTASMRRVRRVRIGKAYRGGGTFGEDEFSGMIGYVVRVCGDRMCEVEGRRSVFVSDTRIETLDPQHERDGVPTPAPWDAVVGPSLRSLEGECRSDRTRAENMQHFEMRLVSPWCVTRSAVAP